MENWIDVKDYEGFYEVSDKGRVRNYKTKYILKPFHNKKGYCIVNLHKNGSIKKFFVHRLVLNSFTENINNFYSINHINEVKSDNRLTNLEWCTIQYNNAYSKNKIVLQYDLFGNFLKEWESVLIASKNTNIKSCNISLCCNGKRKSAGNYIWKYK